MSGSMVKNHISLKKKGIPTQCNMENFVFFVVPGLSASSSSGFYQSTSRTFSRQDSHFSTFSSSSSSSPTTTTSSDSETREREDESEIDSLQCLCQVQMLMVEKGNTMFADSGRTSSEILEWLQEFDEHLMMIEFQYKEVLTPILLMKPLWNPHSRDVRIWVCTAFILISEKTKIARSVRGPKLPSGPKES